MGRSPILHVKENGVEYLPTLATHSLDAVEVPESVVKEWRRRKMGAAIEHAHVELAGLAAPAAGGRASPAAAASKNAASKLSPYLRRIKRMAPQDGRGMWLLNNLLSQTRAEDQEDLCRSIQDKLSKRKEALARSNDHLKLECERRCVFTEAANKIRAASLMTAESNRGNILTSFIKDHHNARRRSDQKRHQKQQQQHRGRTNSLVTAGVVPVPTSPSSARRREKGFSKETPGPKEKGIPRTHSRESELLRPQPFPPSAKIMKAPTSDVIAVAASHVQDRVGAGDGDFNADPAVTAAVAAVAPHSVSRKRRRKAQYMPSPGQEHGDVSNFASSPRGSPPPPPRPLNAEAEAALSTSAKPPVLHAGGKNVWGHHVQGSMSRGLKPLGLPPLEARYGVSVKDGWVPSPVALRLARPRCKSVDIAHLDQPSYKEYMNGVLQGRGVAARQRRQELAQAMRKCFKEQGVMIDSAGDGHGSDLGAKSTISVKGEGKTAAGRCFGGSFDCHGSSGTNSGLDPVASAPISRTQLREPGSGVFRLTNCDFEEPPRTGANGGGREGPGKLHPKPLPNNSGSSSTATADEMLASEELGFRSKGARKVFKQTQRLLEALRTPASSCKVTSTGSRRRCGGANIGGHSSVVIHHHHHSLRHGPAARAAAREHKRIRRGGNSRSGDGSNDSGAIGSDIHAEMWRIPQGNRPARLAEVFRCVAPPHTVSIECELILHDSLRRIGGERDEAGGAGDGGGGGTWDDLVHAWEYLGDGILAGRALSAHWAEVHRDGGDAKSVAARLESVTEGFLSEGLMRALLSTKCYRPPGPDQLLVEWLDELLEAVRAHVQRGCARMPVQHGLTAGLEWFKEVRCSCSST
ncbi:unnamed protein product [Pylaiella littoralis]